MHARGITIVLMVLMGAGLWLVARPASAHADGAAAPPLAPHSGSTPTPHAGSATAPLRIEKTADGIGRVTLSDTEWKKRLTSEQFRILRQKGTEIAFTGRYWDEHAGGVYRCAACGLELFGSDAKFESGTGWPSFWRPIAANHVRVARDTSLFMERDELICPRCGGHLGHVFDDGPPPTGLRYCINSASLEFVPSH
jgi:peptide-methionine (R)-S-oxide reductase